ncbi:MAG: hypothetical protein GC159_10505 [Phycisphaera sp.]|nr:hypothetical protein [Phycisphaera sp.]
MNPRTRLDRWSVFAALVVAMIGSLGPVRAAEQDKDMDAMVKELQALKAKVANLEAKSNDSWLTERRAEEVKTLVHEVLADADTRASLAGEGMTAGWKKHFFLASEDGKFMMELGGQLQFRYLANFNQKDGVSGHSDDDEDQGFQFRRMKLKVKGHVEAGRKWDYELVLAGDRGDGVVEVEDAVIETKIADGLKIKFGKFKLPFLREELTSSSAQLGVDRNVSTEYFTLDRSEQIEVIYEPMDAVKLMLSINDGGDEEFSTIGSDPVEFAITGRADVKLAGEWGQMKDYAAWDGEPFGAFVGAAFHYQIGDGKNAANSSISVADVFSWTVDGSIETNGFSFDAAGMGVHVNYDDDIAADDRDVYGLKLQGAYFVIPNKLQPYVRFDWISEDTDSSDAKFLTFGGNYYFDKHNAKFTMDLVWWLDGELPAGNPVGNGATSDGLGFSSGDPHAEDSLVLRAQFQLLF